MNYYAIHRSNLDDELQHWKYIKKIVKNGKAHYIYDTSELNKYNNGFKQESRNKTGGMNTVVYKKSDRLFDNTSTTKTSLIDSNPRRVNEKSPKPINSKTTTHYQGKLSRAQAKGEKWVYDTFYKKNSKVQKTLRSIKNDINNGRKKLGSILRIKI